MDLTPTAGAVRVASAERTASAVGVKSIAAYRTGLDLNPERPSDPEVTAAAGHWLAVAVIAVIFAPRTARKLGEALAAREGIVAPGTEEAAPRLAAARDEAP